EVLTDLYCVGGTNIECEKRFLVRAGVSTEDKTVGQNVIRDRFRLGSVEADKRREIDSPRPGQKAEHVDPVPLHPIAETVNGLEIVRHGVAVAEGIALVIVDRQIFGELIVHLELEALRHLLLQPDREAAIEG